MPRLHEVPAAEAHEQAQLIYGLLFGDRDPVIDPAQKQVLVSIGGPSRPGCPTVSTASLPASVSTAARIGSWSRNCANSARRAPDGVFNALRADLSDEAILELSYITCTYAMHATMSKALRLEYDDVDEPVAEVRAPAGSTLDAMAVVEHSAATIETD